MVYQYKPFRYKTSTEIKQRMAYKNRIKATKDGEVLTGFVQELKASDIEERFAKGLSKEGISFTFQKSYLAPRNTAGNYMLDFLVEGATKPLPVAVDGEYAHRTAEQKGKDAYKDDIFNTKNSYRYQKVIRVGYNGTLNGEQVLPGLQTQDEADATIQELIWLYHLQ
jgi:poly-D-alanine transfer protein DltD